MAAQCPIWYLTLDELPILLLSSGCEFRAVEAAVPAAKISHATRVPLQFKTKQKRPVRPAAAGSDRAF